MNQIQPVPTTVTASVSSAVIALSNLNPYITCVAGLLAIGCSLVFLYDRFLNKKKD